MSTPRLHLPCVVTSADESLATSALRAYFLSAALLDLGFDAHGRHRVVAQMDSRNSASARLAEAIGLRREAHHRQDRWSKGEWTDTLVYAPLAGDRA